VSDPLVKIRKLLAVAERTTFPEEADACRKKVAKMMAVHHIDAKALEPEPVRVQMPFYSDQTIHINIVMVNNLNDGVAIKFINGDMWTSTFTDVEQAFENAYQDLKKKR
jgi:hypothetical protein